MKVVKLAEFLKLPSGTLYSEWEPAIATGLFVKEETIHHEGREYNDFFLRSLLPQMDGDSDNAVFPDYSERWADYEYDQLFAVYEAEDVQQLLQSIQGV